VINVDNVPDYGPRAGLRAGGRVNVDNVGMPEAGERERD